MELSVVAVPEHLLREGSAEVLIEKLDTTSLFEALKELVEELFGVALFVRLEAAAVEIAKGCTERRRVDRTASRRLQV